MFEQDGSPAGATATAVGEPGEELSEEVLDEAGLAELTRVAQSRLDRMFPRTGPQRSAWRLRQSQMNAAARRAVRKIIQPERRSAWQFGVPRIGTTRSASDLPGLAPGPGLAAAIAELDILKVAEHDLVHVVTATERLAAWTASVQAEAISLLSAEPLYQLDPPPGRSPTVPPGVDAGDPDRVEAWAREHECVRATGAEIGAALRLSRGAAEARVRTARALTGRHLATLGAMRDGAIDLGRAKVIVESSTRPRPGCRFARPARSRTKSSTGPRR